MHRIAIALASAALAAQGAPAEKGKPPLTEQTKRSGGTMPAEQAALQFDHADLAFEIDPERQQIAGVATLRFTAKRPVDRILLDLDRNLAVSSISVEDRPLPSRDWSNPQGRLSIKLPRRLAAGGTTRVKIAYGGTPHAATNAPWQGGFVWAKTPSGKPWMGTAVQGEGCDLIWPCIDQPTGEPRSADLHITVPAGLAAPANGVLTGIEKLPDGRSTYHWRARQPNTYGIALNVGPFELLSHRHPSRFGNVIALEFWHLPEHAEEARRLFAEFVPTLDFLEATVGPYPFADEKMGVVETPFPAMEHQTLNAYGAGFKKQPIGFDWTFHHEFAHEWFGNQFTNEDWDDFWLHEGFTGYMAPLYAKWRGGDFAYHAMMAEWRTSHVNAAPLVLGKSKPPAGISATQNSSVDILHKASWVLHSLRNLIGDEAFFDATRRLVYGRPDPRPGNFRPRYGSTAEFRQIVAQVTGRDLGWFFDAYLEEAQVPELVEERRGDRLTLRWQTSGNRPFPMPVDVSVGGRVHTLAMTGNQGSLAVPAGAHVVLDPKGKILRRSKDIEAFQAWQKAESEKQRAAAAASK